MQKRERHRERDTERDTQRERQRESLGHRERGGKTRVVTIERNQKREKAPEEENRYMSCIHQEIPERGEQISYVCKEEREMSSYQGLAG